MLMKIKVVSLGALDLVLLVYALSRVIERSEAAPACYDGNAATVQLTQYWIPQEGSNDVDDNGNVISLSGPQTESIKQDDGTVIETTDTTTYNKCVEEGTCLLLNGYLVNLASTQETFQILDTSKFPYGQGSSGNALVPFVSVAANDLDQGATLFVSELQNYQLPIGKTHNGCVRVDDMGVNFTCHIDWFVSSYDNEAVILTTNLPGQATVQVSSCTVLNYV